MALSCSPGSHGLGGFNFPSGWTCLPSYIAHEPVTSWNLPPLHYDPGEGIRWIGKLSVLLVVLVPYLLLYCVINHQDVMQHLFMQYLKTLQNALKYDSNTPLSHPFLRKHLTGFRMLKALRGWQLLFRPIIFLFAVFCNYAITASCLSASSATFGPLSSLCTFRCLPTVSPDVIISPNPKVRELMKTWCKEARIYYSLPCAEGYT